MTSASSTPVFVKVFDSTMAAPPSLEEAVRRAVEQLAKIVP
jgi:hypothetical protein